MPDMPLPETPELDPRDQALVDRVRSYQRGGKRWRLMIDYLLDYPNMTLIEMLRDLGENCGVSPDIQEPYTRRRA